MNREYKILMEDSEHQVSVTQEGDTFVVTLDGETHRLVPLLSRAPLYSFLINESRVIEADIAFDKDRCEMNVGHVPYTLEIFDPRHRLASQGEFRGGGASEGIITAPMPGKVVEIKVSAGSKVKKGEAVIIVEAMKMQNELPSPLEGVVKELAVRAGDTVESGQKLVTIAKE